MQDATDVELLRQYANRNSEAAFTELVVRHLNMVYSVALRKTGNPAAAEEITQSVFIILAKKAVGLRKKVIISGWLYQTARLTAASFLRTELRRVRREQEVYMQSLSKGTEPETWLQIVPLLEDAMGRLGEKDRNAIALRFFEKKSFREIGTAIGASENAAKKRVAYALEKLRKYFSKHGLALTTTMIAGAISAHSVQAAPAALVKTVTAVAVAKGAAASGSTLTLIKGVLKIMSWSKAQTVIVIGVATILSVGATSLVLEKTIFNLPEPVYQGRKLSRWLEEYNAGQLSQQASEAVGQIGTNSLPFLIKWIRSENRQKRNAVVAAYGILGSSAVVQVPELTKMLSNKTSTTVRLASAAALGQIGTEAQSSIFALIETSEDKNNLIRNNALWALGRIHQQPDLVIPVLIERLNDPDRTVGENAAVGLAAYGTNAIVAITALENVASENRAAKFALEQIESAGKAK